MDKDETQKKRREQDAKRMKANEDISSEEASEIIMTPPQAVSIAPAGPLVTIITSISIKAEEPRAATYRNFAPRGWVIADPEQSIISEEVDSDIEELVWPDSDDSDAVSKVYTLLLSQV
jgi:hypothetical protein